MKLGITIINISRCRYNEVLQERVKFLFRFILRSSFRR